MFAGLALAALALGSQQNPRENPPPAADFGASIDVRAVNVEAVVTDRRGERVRGLKAADFRLLVDGREVPIDDFTEVAGGEVAGAAPESSPPAAPAPPTTAATLAAARIGTSYLVFIDESFAVAVDRDILLKRLAKDLRLGPEDRMAIVAFDGRKLDRLIDWTGDREALLRTLEEARHRPARGLERLVMRERAAEDGAAGVGEVEDLFFEARSAAQAAVAAMRGLAVPPGRKVLFLFSGGWPSLPVRPLLAFSGPPSPANLAEQVLQNGFEGPPSLRLARQQALPAVSSYARPADLFEPVTGTANLLGYTIYPMSAPIHGPGSLWNDVQADGPSFGPPGFISSQWKLGVDDTLGYLASETGGRMVFDSVRRGAFSRLQEDLRSYYWLSFTPEWRADGRTHQIRLEVRRAGLTARSRSGFADLTRGEQASLRTDSLMLFGGAPATQRIEVEAGAARRAGFGEVTLPVTLVLPAELLKPRQVAGGYELRARLSMGALDRWGGRTQMRDLPLLVRLETPPRAQEPVRFQTTLKLRKTAQALTFAVQDEEGAGLGWGRLDVKP
jgi:VWFA-related protein